MISRAAPSRRWPICGPRGNWQAWSEKAADKLFPILLVGGFAIPVTDSPVIIDDYFRNLGKEEAKVPYDDVLVVQVRTPYFSLVLAARGEHTLGWGIVRASYHLADEAELPRGNHILDAWYVIKHLTHLLVSYLSFLYIGHREVKYLSNILMEKNLKLTKEGLLQRPVLTTP